jgi:hypothetical protein
MLSLLLASAAVVVTPADTSQCAKVAPVTVSTDILALQADADCFTAAATADKAAASTLSKAASTATAAAKYRLDRIAYIKAHPPTQKCPDGSIILASAVCPPPPPPPPSPVVTPPPPVMVHCPDGSMVTPPSVCSGPPPAPVETGYVNGYLPTPALGVGAPDIPTTDHDVMDDLIYTGSMPGPGYPDPQGALRFLCSHTNLKYDDPTVYWGQPGKSHLHDQTGNRNWNAFSTYENLRAGGGSDCNNVAAADKDDSKLTHAANRTPYWQPGMLILVNGVWNVLNLDWTQYYYKRRPLTDPVESDPANPQYMGKAVPLPNGLKFVFGMDFATGKSDGSHVYFSCQKGAAGGGGAPVNYEMDLKSAATCAASALGNSLVVRAAAPDCWDGKYLDTPDHRAHMGFAGYGSWGYRKCDAAHPFVIPSFSYIASYTILPGDDISSIHFASDEMDPTKPAGWSFHVDYGPAAWDPKVWQMIEDGCLNSDMSCNGGQIGNGWQLKGAGSAYYKINGVWTRTMINPERLVPVPARP